MSKQNAEAKAKIQASKVTLTIADHNRDELDELKNYRNLVENRFQNPSTLFTKKIKIFIDRTRFIGFGFRQRIIAAKRIEILKAFESEFESVSPVHRPTTQLGNPFSQLECANEG